MLLRTEARLLARDPGVAFVGVLAPIAILFAVSLLPDAEVASDDLGGLRVIDTFVPTLGVFAIGVLGLMVLPAQLASYRESGVLKRLRTTPASPSAVVGAQLVLNGAIALVTLVAVAVVGRLAFDIALPAPIGGWIVAVALATTSILAIGMVVAALAPSAKLAGGIGTGLWFPLMFFGGLWIPRPAMSDTLVAISDLTPIGAAVGALQDVTTGGSFPDPGYLVVMAGWTAVMTLVAVRAFRWE